MKILIDECAPRELGAFLSKHGHQCLTVQDMSWSGKQNGELLALAESAFEVWVTVDSNLQYQICRSNRLVDLRPLFPRVQLQSKPSNAGMLFWGEIEYELCGTVAAALCLG